jgi:hypothetical protein
VITFTACFQFSGIPPEVERWVQALRNCKRIRANPYFDFKRKVNGFPVNGISNLKIKRCKNCGKQFVSRAETCPSCKTSHIRGYVSLKSILIIIVVVFIFVFVANFFAENSKDNGK